MFNSPGGFPNIGRAVCSGDYSGRGREIKVRRNLGPEFAAALF
jgi:hypothetical protein